MIEERTRAVTDSLGRAEQLSRPHGVLAEPSLGIGLAWLKEEMIIFLCLAHEVTYMG